MKHLCHCGTDPQLPAKSRRFNDGIAAQGCKDRLRLKGLLQVLIFSCIAVCLLLSAARSRPVRIFMVGDSTMATQRETKAVVDSLTGKSIEEPLLMKGAVPILCTSIARRKFDKKGKPVNTHGVYTDVVRSIAGERNILPVDMESASSRLPEAYGVEKSPEIYLNVPPGVNQLYPSGRVDNTHFAENGACIMAQVFVEESKNLNIPALTAQLVPDVGCSTK
ncbi:MAG: hypothetical protein LBC40_07610 [Dysgonamonadaceae bacterium]|jgi:hypothetical protein|nr:hypothetical protein [Dysgonamonadaceae bacterium]